MKKSNGQITGSRKTPGEITQQQIKRVPANRNPDRQNIDAGNLDFSKKKRKKRKRSILKKIVLTVFVILIICGIISGLGYLYLYDLLGEMSHMEIPSGDKELGIGDEKFIFDDSGINYDGIISEEFKDRSLKLPFYHEDAKGITNFAIFGIDSAEGKNGRSDAIIILTIDSRNKKIKLSSVIRDSYVQINGHGMDKINHAYAFGGPELAIETLNRNFNLDIRHFVTVNFSSMPEVIDSLGGIYLDITDIEAAKIPGIESAGLHLLNGEQALTFSRLRKIDSDLERSRRQRDVMESLIEKIFDESVFDYPQLAREIFPLIQTNIDKNTLILRGAAIVMRNIKTVEQKQFPETEYAKGQTIDGIYYYVFDRMAAVNEMGKFIYMNE